MKKNLKKSSTLNDSVSEPTHDSNGSFSVGFLLGALGAAAGMWFVRSEQGQKVYQALKKEFLEEVVPVVMPEETKNETPAEKPKATWSSKFPKFGKSREK